MLTCVLEYSQLGKCRFFEDKRVKNNKNGKKFIFSKPCSLGNCSVLQVHNTSFKEKSQYAKRCLVRKRWESKWRTNEHICTQWQASQGQVKQLDDRVQ